MKKILLIVNLLISFNLFAEVGKITGLDIPRFVSLKSDDVNLRVGPSVNYPIELNYVQKNLPVEIIDEFDVWRKVKDHHKNIGWLHKSLIKGDRFVLTINKNKKKNIYKRPNGQIIGQVSINNIFSLKSCLTNWCLVSNKDIKGWVSKDFIWGVYKYEIYNQNFFQPLINQYWKVLDSKFISEVIYPSK